MSRSARIDQVVRGARSIARFSLVALLLFTVVAVLFVAWWIAACVLALYGLYVGIRRVAGRKPEPDRGPMRNPGGPAPAGGTSGGNVIEGEYRVESEPAAGDASRLGNPTRGGN